MGEWFIAEIHKVTIATKAKAHEAYRWRRYSTPQSLARFVAYLVTVIVLTWALRTITVFWPWVWDAPREIRDMVTRMFPPATAQLPGIITAVIETINIATMGTAIAVVLALPVAYIGASNVTPGRPLLLIGKFIIVATRSVDTLIWALLFVAIFGPGAVAGIVAIAFRSIGFLGKLIGEAIEEVDWGPVEALQAVGASPAHVLIYGVAPQVFPAFMTVAILRWDVNIRESTVLGLVGAGGIGFILQVAIDTFRWNTVATVLISILAVVFLAEFVTGYLRRKVI